MRAWPDVSELSVGVCMVGGLGMGAVGMLLWWEGHITDPTDVRTRLGYWLAAVLLWLMGGVELVIAWRTGKVVWRRYKSQLRGERDTIPSPSPRSGTIPPSKSEDS